jgi:predicted nucleic acid-binding protein
LLVDTGFLAAYLLPDEQHHGWACAVMEKCRGALITCEPVLTEAFFLLRALRPQAAALEEMLLNGVFDVSFSFAHECRHVVALRRSYRDVPMSLADACLVRLPELHPKFPVLTLNSDFRFYRRNKRQMIPIIAPFQTGKEEI